MKITGTIHADTTHAIHPRMMTNLGLMVIASYPTSGNEYLR